MVKITKYLTVPPQKIVFWSTADKTGWLEVPSRDTEDRWKFVKDGKDWKIYAQRNCDKPDKPYPCDYHLSWNSKWFTNWISVLDADSH